MKTRSQGRLIGALILGLWMSPLLAADINFVVQPIIDREATAKAYQPLADYLAKASGKSVQLLTAYDFADFWLTMKQGKRYNLILDSAFYTDYRIKNMGYVPLVKVPGLVSYSLVSLAAKGFFDSQDLIGHKVASLIPPSPGGLVLSRMYPVATRQPVIIPAKDSEHAIEDLRKGSVDAAMVPTPVAAREMEAGAELSVISTSEQFPHITLSAGPDIDADTRQKIAQALLNAPNTPEGQAMLEKIGFASFEVAEPKIFDGYAKYLEEGWLQ